MFVTSETRDLLDKKVETFVKRHPTTAWIIIVGCIWLGIQQTKNQLSGFTQIQVYNIQEKYESYSFLTDEHTDYYLFVDQTSQESFYGETKLPLHIRQKIDTSICIDSDTIFAVIQYPLFNKENFRVIRVDIGETIIYTIHDTETAPPD